MKETIIILVTHIESKIWNLNFMSEYEDEGNSIKYYEIVL